MKQTRDFFFLCIDFISHPPFVQNVEFSNTGQLSLQLTEAFRFSIHFDACGDMTGSYADDYHYYLLLTLSQIRLWIIFLSHLQGRHRHHQDRQPAHQ